MLTFVYCFVERSIRHPVTVNINQYLIKTTLILKLMPISKFDDDDDWLFHILYKESENKSVVF